MPDVIKNGGIGLAGLAVIAAAFFGGRATVDDSIGDAGVAVAINADMMRVAITEPIADVKQLGSEQVTENRPIYDSLEHYTGSVAVQVIRAERTPLYFDAEAATGDVYHAIYLKNDSLIRHVTFTVPDMPEGKICKMNSVNDFVFDLPAKR